MNETEFARYLAVLLEAGIEPTIVPVTPGTKIPAVKWAKIAPGTITPDFPGTQARALLTGSRSGGIVVVDVDSKSGGFETLQRYEAEHGRIPATLTVRSPTGGLHIYLLSPERFRSVTNGLGPGVDIRGEGGIVLTPGSLHPTAGGIYRIEDPE